MKEHVNKLISVNKKLQALFNENDILLRHCRKIGRMECGLLEHLYKSAKPICMNDLSSHLNVSHSRITRIVDNLVKKELVSRYPSTVDRRRWYTEINELGIEVAESAEAENEELQERIMQQLPKGEADNVIKYLEMYIDAFKKTINETEE